jgi:predicted nucleotidyltransferase
MKTYKVEGNEKYEARLDHWRDKDPNLNSLLERARVNHPEKQLVLLFQAGSHFFDLNGPNSDTDYRGVYVDMHQDSYDSAGNNYLIDYKTKEGSGKNSNKDTDLTLFSLSSYIKLLRQGDFNCMEILFIPESKIIYKTPIYDEIVARRKEYLVNDVSAFLGFVRKEYKRYGVNIHHYGQQQRFVEFLRQFPMKDKLQVHWKEIVSYAEKTGEVKITNTKVDNSKSAKNIPSVSIATRLHHNTATVEYVIGAIERNLEKYGHRQKSMAADGVEFKGLYHALRCIYEANDIYDHGELRIPLNPWRHWVLKLIKNGNMPQRILFWMIDSKMEKLRKREMVTKSNRHIVESKLDRLEMTLRGKFSVLNDIVSLKVATTTEDFHEQR